MGTTFTIGAHTKGRGFFATASSENASVWIEARQAAADTGAAARIQTMRANCRIKELLLLEWQNTSAHKWLSEFTNGSFIETAVCYLDEQILKMGIVIGFIDPVTAGEFEKQYLGTQVSANRTTKKAIAAKSKDFAPDNATSITPTINGAISSWKPECPQATAVLRHILNDPA